MEKYLFRKHLIYADKNRKNWWHPSHNLLMHSTPQASATKALLWVTTVKKMGQEGKNGGRGCDG